MIFNFRKYETIALMTTFLVLFNTPNIFANEEVVIHEDILNCDCTQDLVLEEVDGILVGSTYLDYVLEVTDILSVSVDTNFLDFNSYDSTELFENGYFYKAMKLSVTSSLPYEVYMILENLDIENDKNEVFYIKSEDTDYLNILNGDKVFKEGEAKLNKLLDNELSSEDREHIFEIKADDYPYKANIKVNFQISQK
jgi:hypothetical protein